MFITKSKHKKIVEKTEQLYTLQIDSLKKELALARDLKDILNRLYDRSTIIGSDEIIVYSDGDVPRISLSDTVPVYVDDLFGGKVIKQEANKAILITKDGEVKIGVTKQKVDKGYNYKLKRE